MENFFNWMAKTVPEDEVTIWFNVHNMTYEKIGLIGDFFRSLNQTILDTYLGNDDSETKILLTQEDKDSHFDWCWKNVLDCFKKENIIIKHGGEHKMYLKEFFMDTFYNQSEDTIKNTIPNFIEDVFDVEKPFTKADLDILTEIYKLWDKNIE